MICIEASGAVDVGFTSADWHPIIAALAAKKSAHTSIFLFINKLLAIHL
jgi:hypothetical protein